MIIILGILITLGFQKNFFKEKRCDTYLSSALLNFQNEISLHFTKTYFSHHINTLSDLKNIFQKYATQNTPSCSLILNQEKLFIIATNNNLQTTFNITPKDLTTNLKIQCTLSNALCKKIHHRYSSK
ncbi:hypothetical protein [Helicobacter anseris]|uniref:hypothetical protein n=1 Tax=Helicobacter anseris TaxID=375926 RepID=UPI0011C0714B|nr:hypothetical protein [Helicobacter anseris]